MRYIEMAKYEMYNYKSNCNELIRMRREDKPSIPNIVSGHVKGRISRPVEAEVMRRLSDERLQYLIRSTQAVEFALAMVQRKKNGELTVKIFDMVYKQSTHRLYGAALELHISERTAQEYNSYLVKMVALKLGILPAMCIDN